MQFFRRFLAVLAVLAADSIWTVAAAPLVKVSFEASRIGPYAAEEARRDWGAATWVGLHDRAEIVPDGSVERGRVLRIAYPKGAVGPREGGGQFEVSLPPSAELWLSYQVKFGAGFDFRLGGKLPGLTSGGGKFTGGHRPEKGEGWSARYMWRARGEAVVYFYHVGMKGKWGDDLSLGGVRFQPGVWHRITQRIRVNAPELADGKLEVWIDGKKVLSRGDVRFRIGDRGLIDTLYFSTFHGGSSKEWGPAGDCFAYFDDFVVSATPLEGG